MTPSVGSRPLCNPVARISRYICLRKPTSSPRPFRTDGLDKKGAVFGKIDDGWKIFRTFAALRENRTMKIREEYKVREMAGEHVVIMQGRLGVDMTKIISLNESALYLWNALAGKGILRRRCGTPAHRTVRGRRRDRRTRRRGVGRKNSATAN